MKIQAEIVISFLDQIKALVEDINLTVRMGDDGFEESVSYQVDNVSKAIEVFKLQQLTQVTPIESAAKRYNRIYEQLSEKQDKDISESRQLYKSELYFAMKRLVKADANIAEIPELELCNYIESLVPDNSNYKKLIYSNEFFQSSINVIQEVADEITEQRRKAPQTKLF